MAANDDGAPAGARGVGRIAAEVALGMPLPTTFHYAIPDSCEERVVRGSVVLVPFGRNFVSGYVVSVGPPPADASYDLKPIHEVIEPDDAIDGELFRLAEFVADYYLAPLGEVLRNALPSSSASSKLRASLTPEGQDALTAGGLSDAERRVLDVVASHGPLTAEVAARRAELSSVGVARSRLRALEQRGLVTLDAHIRRAARRRTERVVERTAKSADGVTAIARSKVAVRALEVLSEAGGSATYTALRKLSNVGPKHLELLTAAGLVRVVEAEIDRDVRAQREATRRLSDFTLTDEQSAIAGEVSEAVRRGSFQPFLLHGVTGAGKSLVYFEVIEAALAAGKSALMLVPEISLTPVLGRELRGRFGDAVAVLHSALPAGERYDAWRRVRAGRARVVFGARSAVFAPVQELGVIIVDEEHDHSYKQDERPHYHARDVAVARANQQGVPVLLGSATPSLESYKNAIDGRYRLLELNSRVAGQLLPTVDVVDLRDEAVAGPGSLIISQRLADELTVRVQAGEQSVLLLNRRGYASFLLCRECGERVECPNCSVCLTYHRAETLIKCHHCDHQRPPPTACAKCKGVFLNLVGHGTEKVEAAVRELLPEARVARLDRDAARRRDEVENILRRFEHGEIDILIGTQMVAKGHDFPRVTLVGVVSVDAMLALPDFRATERAFSLLTQVAGRAGRGERPGHVLLQTFHPENEAVRLACEQDYVSFYEREIKLRQLMRYPPAAHLAGLIIRGKDREQVMREARAVARVLRDVADPGVRLLGPAMAPVQRLKGQFRAQLLVKSASRKRLRAALAAADEKLRAKGSKVNLDVDVDPQDLL